MPKPENKDKIEAHLLKEQVQQLKALAEKEHRTLKNYVEMLLIKHLEEKQKDKK